MKGLTRRIYACCMTLHERIQGQFISGNTGDIYVYCTLQVKLLKLQSMRIRPINEKSQNLTFSGPASKLKLKIKATKKWASMPCPYT